MSKVKKNIFFLNGRLVFNFQYNSIEVVFLQVEKLIPVGVSYSLKMAAPLKCNTSLIAKFGVIDCISHHCKMPNIDCEQSLFCSKIRRETRKEELETTSACQRNMRSREQTLLAARGFSTRRSYVTHAVTLIFPKDFRAKERLLTVYAEHSTVPERV